MLKIGCSTGGIDIIDAVGMYSGEAYSMVITVLNSKNINDFMSMMKAHTDTFIYFSDGVKVQGDYHFGDNIGNRITAY